MKRCLSIILCTAMMCVLILGMSGNAAAVEKIELPSGLVKISESTQQISEDLYLIIAIYEEPGTTYATRYTKTGYKTYRAINTSGECLWTFTIEADYIITSGISSTCTAVSHSYEIYNSSWNYVSGSSYKSGNCAYGSAEFNRRLLGIVVETRTCDVSLACDVNGNLS